MNASDHGQMPRNATDNLIVWAVGFGTGAFITLFGFLGLVGIRHLG
jgi:hypothetical protein